ncbi:DUF1381 domain-containing protein [Staphylococcus gallinarum]|nr:DUF1381 domain-containing protein [Staphylococcus gallinarum]MCD8921681.1 DUF1381 domain-containing protein [Staphylococcus gallinarum]
MTQYLIRTLTDSTGHTFTHVTQARENETYQVVEAESKEEALEIAMGEVILRLVITKNYQPPEFDGGERGVSPSLTDEQVQKLIELSGRKDSE